MKKRFLVTITKTIEIEVADASLTPDALAEFGKTIFEMDSPEALVKHCAERVALDGEHFVEGVGIAIEAYRTDKPDAPIRFTEEEFDVETMEVTC